MKLELQGARIRDVRQLKIDCGARGDTGTVLNLGSVPVCLPRAHAPGGCSVSG